MNIGDRMKKRRKELGISADDVAEYIGVDRTTYYRYERGAISKVSADVLQKIAGFLRTTPTWLMGMEDETYPFPNAGSFPSSLSPDDKEAFDLYRRLDVVDRAEVRGMMKGMLLADKYQSKDKGGSVG